MMVLVIVGYVLLAIFIILFVAGLMLLFAHTRIDFRAENKRFEVRIGIGLIRIQVWPFSKKIKIQSDKAHQASAEEKPPPPSKISLGEIDWRDALDLVLDMLEQMKDRLYLETIFADVLIGTENAASTALLLGYSAAAAGMILPFLEQNFNIQNCQVTVDGDFDADSTHWKVKLIFAVQPIRMFAVLWHHRKRLRAMYRQIIKKKEAKTDERSSN